MKVLISDAANNDLLQLFSYLFDRNPVAADEILGDIDLKIRSLTNFPFIGRLRSTLGAELRSVVCGMYVIFYQVGRDQITVLRVLDGRRDIDTEFQR